MARRRWCETCDNEALPDTVPAACEKCKTKAESREGKCKGKTKFKQPCTFNAIEGEDFCHNHKKAKEGTHQLQTAKDCRYKEIDGCPKKAARGFAECARHIEDPEERKRERKRIEVERATGSARLRALMMGELSVEDLTDEEILQGKFLDKNGELTGRPPAIIPREVHEKMTAELFRRAEGRLKSRLFDVIETMTEIAAGEEDGEGNQRYEPKDRIKAAIWVAERLMGKLPEVVTHKQERPFEVMYTNISAGARSTRGSSALQVESEVVEEAEIVDED